MSRIVFAAICLIIVICSCNQAPKTTNREELTVSKINDSLKVHRIVLPNDSGIVFLDFEKGKIKERIRKDSAQTVVLEFNPGDSTKLSAWLSSDDSLANVRFTQIIMPDSTADGPFGQKIEYSLTQKGTYKLLVNENMMAGDPWAGVFILKMKITK